MINWLKTQIIKWAMEKMIERFVTFDDKELIEIHLRTGYIICTRKDLIKSAVETVIDNNKLKFD